MSQFTLFKRGSPCPVCDSQDERCKSTIDGLILCMTLLDAADVPGYRYIGRTQNGVWGEWAPDDRNSSEQEREQWRRDRERKRQQRQQEEAERRAQAMSAAERDRHYRQLLEQLTLHPDDRADLRRRGLTDEQIETASFKSVDQWQKLERELLHTLPGVNLDGLSLNTQSGCLCPIRDVNGLIVGAQVRLRNPQGGGRYRWLTSAIRKRPNGPTPHLPNGELPLAVYRPERVVRHAIALVEGTGAKSLITSQRLGIVTIGAAGGQFAGSPETLKASLEQLAAETNSRTIEFYPDAGAVGNQNVLRQYRSTWELLRQWEYQVGVAWWNQFSKADFDIDELPDISSVEFIGTAEFEAIANSQKPAESEEIDDGPQQQAEAQEQLDNENPSSIEGIDLKTLGDYKPEELVRRYFDRITNQPIADWICVNNRLHRWVGTHYEYTEDGIVLRQIIEFLRSLYWVRDSRNGVAIKYPYGSDRQARSALETVKTSTFMPIEQIPRHGLNLANGTLLVNYETGAPKFELVPHDRSRYYLAVSPVAWNPVADTAEAERLLKAVKSGQLESFLRHQSTFFDFQLVAKKLGRPRAGICEGEGSNGKDAIRQAIELLFSRIGNFSFEDFRAYDDGKRFPLATLPNYQYSWASENSHKVKLENLKSLMSAIVGNSPLWSEFKNKDLQQYYPKACLWFSVNKAPMTDGSASFIKSRFAVYQFDKVFTKLPTGTNELQADPRFAYDEDFRINEVCPGLLRLLAEAYQRLWAEGIDWEPCEVRLRDWAKEHNHLLEFADDTGLTVNPDGAIPIAALYDSLKDWYRVNDYLDIDGDGRQYWQAPPSNFDALVKRPNDLFKRLKEVFPRIEKATDTDGSITGAKGRAYLRGLSFGADKPDPMTDLDAVSGMTPEVSVAEDSAEVEGEVDPAEVEHWESQFLATRTDEEVEFVMTAMAERYPQEKHPLKKAVWERLRSTPEGKEIRKRVKRLTGKSQPGSGGLASV